MADLINLIRIFFYSTEVFALEAIFFFIRQFFEKYLNFFRSVHLVENYSKNVDERGRNFICERTLPSLLVFFQTLNKTFCWQSRN